MFHNVFVKVQFFSLFLFRRFKYADGFCIHVEVFLQAISHTINANQHSGATVGRANWNTKFE